MTAWRADKIQISCHGWDGLCARKGDVCKGEGKKHTQQAQRQARLNCIVPTLSTVMVSWTKHVECTGVSTCRDVMFGAVPADREQITPRPSCPRHRFARFPPGWSKSAVNVLGKLDRFMVSAQTKQQTSRKRSPVKAITSCDACAVMDEPRRCTMAHSHSMQSAVSLPSPCAEHLAASSACLDRDSAAQNLILSRPGLDKVSYASTRRLQ